MPKTCRIDTHFQKKFAYFCLKVILNIVAATMYELVLVTPFKIIPQHFQWMLGLLTPLPKMLLIKLYLKICSKAHESIPHSVKVSVVHNAQIIHALAMVLFMGSVTNRTTSYTILGIKLFISMYKGLKIIFMLKFNKKGYSVKEGRFQLYKNMRSHPKS